MLKSNQNTEQPCLSFTPIPSTAFPKTGVLFLLVKKLTAIKFDGVGKYGNKATQPPLLLEYVALVTPQGSAPLIFPPVTHSKWRNVRCKGARKKRSLLHLWKCGIAGNVAWCVQRVCWLPLTACAGRRPAAKKWPPPRSRPARSLKVIYFVVTRAAFSYANERLEGWPATWK